MKQEQAVTGGVLALDAEEQRNGGHRLNSYVEAKNQVGVRVTGKRSSDMAETLIRSTGERLTTARVQVLRVLLDAGRALTHHEVEQRVGGELPIDRVTIYRVLEWLTKEKLAHKIAGDDRVWRFDAPVSGNSDNRAHFKCLTCGHITGIEHQIGSKALKLPGGYTLSALEVVARGVCANCGGHAESVT